MAKKKTVSISRKPSASPDALIAEGVGFIDAAVAEPCATNLQGSREIRTKPATGAIGRAIYGVAYCLSFGVVFGAIVVGKLIPGSGLIGLGFCDGGNSARRYFEAEPEPPEFEERATYAA